MSHIPNTITSAHVRPGTIPARNRDTGVLFRIRPEMIDQHPTTWELISEEEFLGVSVASKITLPSEAPKAGPTVVTKADGKPFKTEAAARATMKRKKLSDMLVVPDAEGFVITSR